MPTTRPRRAGIIAAACAVAVTASLAVYLGLRPGPALLPQLGSGCQARASGMAIPLAPSQAGIAATIAGVAQHRALPGRAVTVAYATAWQESKLQNLNYGDRDSVGVFQQRPSQGWGPRRLLLQPVYATTRFFAALAAVPRYRRLPVYRAAQAVQRSADGLAYAQYTGTAAVMSRAFSGREPHAVWCWFGAGVTGPARLASAAAELRRTFGQIRLRTTAAVTTARAVTAAGAAAPAFPALVISARQPRDQWAEAAWLVAHAPAYGIREVRCGGLTWTAKSGASGWRPAGHGPRRTPTPGMVSVG